MTEEELLENHKNHNIRNIRDKVIELIYTKQLTKVDMLRILIKLEEFKDSQP